MKNSDPQSLEESPYFPNSPYSASKASADHLVRAWNKTFGLPVITTNCTNNYGPFQHSEKLIPKMISHCIQGEELPIYGTGKNIRDWLYVDDHCDAIELIFNNGNCGETYNIGGNQEVKNIDIVSNICNILDKEKPLDNCRSYKDLITFVKDRPGHDFRYAIDSSKIENKLGFHTKYNIKTGLKKTINWYLSNIEWVDQIRIQKYNQKRLGVI